MGAGTEVKSWVWHDLQGRRWICVAAGGYITAVGGRLDPGQVGRPALVSVLMLDIRKGFPPCLAAAGLVEGV